MASSAFRALRERYPYSKITLLTVPIIEDLAQDCPYFDEIVYFKCPWPAQSIYKYDLQNIISVIKCLRSKQFELVIDMRGDLRNILFMSFLGARYRISFTIGGGGFLLTHKVPYGSGSIHQVYHNLEIAKFLGAEINTIKPELWTRDLDGYKKRVLEYVGKKENEILVAIHPGANWYGRRWSPDRFKDVAEKLSELENVKVAIVGSPAESLLVRKIADGNALLRVVITKSLKELTIFLQECDLLVCNDSAPMHIAVAVNTPTVALFGPQEPGFHGPYGDENIVIRHKVACSPCVQHLCRLSDNSCMNLISVEEVYNSIINLLEKK